MNNGLKYWNDRFMSSGASHKAEKSMLVSSCIAEEMGRKENQQNKTNKIKLRM